MKLLHYAFENPLMHETLETKCKSKLDHTSICFFCARAKNIKPNKICLTPSLSIVNHEIQDFKNKNTKCPIDAHCQRHRRKDLRITKDCNELISNSQLFLLKKEEDLRILLQWKKYELKNRDPTFYEKGPLAAAEIGTQNDMWGIFCNSPILMISIFAAEK